MELTIHQAMLPQQVVQTVDIHTQHRAAATPVRLTTVLMLHQHITVLLDRLIHIQHQALPIQHQPITLQPVLPILLLPTHTQARAVVIQLLHIHPHLMFTLRQAVAVQAITHPIVPIHILHQQMGIQPHHLTIHTLLLQETGQVLPMDHQPITHHHTDHQAIPLLHLMEHLNIPLLHHTVLLSILHLHHMDHHLMVLPEAMLLHQQVVWQEHQPAQVF